MRRAEEEKCSTGLTLRTVGGVTGAAGAERAKIRKRKKNRNLALPHTLLYSRPNPCSDCFSPSFYSRLVLIRRLRTVSTLPGA
jgi:hypothetical protein